MGVDWVPFSRGDLEQVEEGRTSGTGVGEFDGVLVPSLRFHGGWEGDRWAVLGGLAVARSTSTTWVGTDYTQIHVGALRPSADLRYHLLRPTPTGAFPWVEGGLYGVIPSARNVSGAYTDEEQVTADEGSAVLRKTVGAVGVEIGPGFSWRFTPSLSVGASYHFILYRGQSLTQDTLSVSTWIWSEAAFILEARFPHSEP